MYTITVNHDNWKSALAITYDPSLDKENTIITVGTKKLPPITATGISDAVAKGLAAVFGKSS